MLLLQLAYLLVFFVFRNKVGLTFSDDPRSLPLTTNCLQSRFLSINAKRRDDTGIPEGMNIDPDDSLTVYVASLHFAFMTITSIGLGGQTLREENHMI